MPSASQALDTFVRPRYGEGLFQLQERGKANLPTHKHTPNHPAASHRRPALERPCPNPHAPKPHRPTSCCPCQFAWRYWTSAAKPFGADAVAYVAALNADDDVSVARRAGLDESACATLRVATMLLKRAVLGPSHLQRSTACTPRLVSTLVMRDRFDEPSPLERLCAQALGLPGAESGLTDTGLTDFIASEQRQRGEPADAFVPSGQFYERFEALLQADESIGGHADAD